MGAFSYRVGDKDKAYVFGLWTDSANKLPDWPDGALTSFLASKEDPSQPGPYHKEFNFSTGAFWGVAAVVVEVVVKNVPTIPVFLSRRGMA